MGASLYYGSPLNRSHPLMRGVVGRWKVAPWYSSGPRWIDLSGFRLHGTLNNGTAWAARIGGRAALSFDGSDDFVALGTSGLPTIQGAKTVACWLRYASVPGSTQSIWTLVLDDTSGANNAVGLEIGRGGSGNINVAAWGGTSLVHAVAPSSNVWHHIVYSTDDPTQTASQHLYVDGVEIGSQDSGSAQTGTAAVFAAGRFNNAFPQNWAGLLDDIIVYPRMLAASEIRQLFDATVRQDDPTLSWIEEEDLFPTATAVAGSSAVKTISGQGGGNWIRSAPPVLIY